MTFRDMLLGSHWAGRVWTGRDEQRELQGLAIQARMVGPGVVGGGEASVQRMFPQVVVAVDFGRIRFHAWMNAD